ncbi:hypothetical protein [Natranaerobius trueperi]|nr:hypothetical protein [Natranaerobius trueperi]
MEDKLIGLIGSLGTGKSLLTEGMFNDITLNNDDLKVISAHYRF